MEQQLELRLSGQITQLLKQTELLMERMFTHNVANNSRVSVVDANIRHLFDRCVGVTSTATLRGSYRGYHVKAAE